jgi:hypothetical protein
MQAHNERASIYTAWPNPITHSWEVFGTPPDYAAPRGRTFRGRERGVAGPEHGPKTFNQSPPDAGGE